MSDTHSEGTEKHPAEKKRGALADTLAREEFSFSRAVGGKRGLAEGVVPTAIFVIAYTISRDVALSGALAGASIAVFLLLRIIAKQRIDQVFGGAVAVGIGVLWALKTGNDSAVYLPSLLVAGLYGGICLLSILLGHPLVGLLAQVLDPRVKGWREVPAVKRLYLAATGVLTGLFALRLLVLLPLFYAGQVEALGIARIILGLPLFALVLWVIWRLHGAAVQLMPAAAEEKIAEEK
ncbi:DUF3159 domain-containing protein [Dermabacteraceae bacterium P13077]